MQVRYINGKVRPQFKSKDDDMDKHVIKRFKQRFDLDLSKSDLKKICHKIKSKTCEFVFRESNTKEFWIVDYMDTKFVAIYYPRKNKLRTVIPVEWLDDYEVDPYRDLYDEFKKVF